MLKKVVCVGLLLLAWAPEVLNGQNLAPNPSFELGTSQPSSWPLLYPGEAFWENIGRTGTRSVSVVGNGSTCGRRWRTTECDVEPGRAYLLRFWAMGSNAVGGTCIAGFDVANHVVARDLGPVPNEWSPYSFVAVIPNNVTALPLEVGQCVVNGKIFFDDVELLPVVPLHMEVQGAMLGSGESFRPGHYAFRTLLGDSTANYSRCLQEHTANFATDGWTLATGRSVVYRHAFPTVTFTNADIQVTAKSQSGILVVDVSPDGSTWQEAARHSATNSPTVVNTSVPAELLPCEALFVRLRAEGSAWVTEYRLDAGSSDIVSTAEGKTWFLDQQLTNSTILPTGLSALAGGYVLRLEIRNPEDTELALVLGAVAQGLSGTRDHQETAVIAPFTTNTVHLALPSAGEGENSVTVSAYGSDPNTPLLQGTLTLEVTRFADNSFGHLLPSDPHAPVWWCEGTYKVFRERSLPATASDAVEISAARNEYEPFQLVLRPDATSSNVSVWVSDFTMSDELGASTIGSSNVQACLVEYVPVFAQYDAFSKPGFYPDPLLPVTTPFEVAAHTNQPVWLTIFVPKDARAGDYTGNVILQCEAWTNSVPIRLHVYDFSLSDVTHTRSAYGLHVDNQWHGFPTPEQRRQIYELYMENFRRHRLSPYFRETTFAPLWPTWTLSNGSFTHDFTGFDSTVGRWLDEFQFNAFQFLHEPDTLGGHKRFSAEYAELFTSLVRPIARHLRERGWMDKAYAFWSDEPQPHFYPTFIKGMETHLQAVPDLRRMVTTWQYNAALFGHADIWVPFFSSQFPLEPWGIRISAGEELWWYVAGIPKAPSPNNFVDHPSVSPRIRAWMAENYGTTGELMWYTTYFWGSNSAPRDPYIDPMVRDHNGNPLGNGNGCLLYPPTKAHPTSPLISGPVDSLRWEMLREGQEDREYFWLLKEWLAVAESTMGPDDPAVQEGYASRSNALALVPSVSDYEMDPARLHAARRRVGEAIERLDDGSPMLVRQPVSQVGAAGGQITLRSECLGWPIPDCQWQQNGQDLPGASSAILVLSNLDASQLGDYRIVYSNGMGTVTSAVVTVAGHWIEAPQLLSHPEDLTRWAGSHAAFAVTAVSSLPMAYQWFFNENVVGGATNDSLLLTNLQPADSGQYHAVVSTVFGAVTSRVATLTVAPVTSLQTLIPSGAVWRFNDAGFNLGTSWRTLEYDDSTWSSGPAQLGYGDGDEATLVAFGPDPDQKPITTYFRHTFLFTNSPAACYALTARTLKDDAAVAYLNGVEVYRSGNLPLGAVYYNTPASQGFWEKNPVEGESETTWYPTGISPQRLREGTNVLAVEVHQYSASDPDLSFDFELLSLPMLPPVVLSHPRDSTRYVGERASMQAECLSAGPTTYTWEGSGGWTMPTPGSVLHFSAVSTNEAGSYRLIAQNPAGAAESDPALLTVLEAPCLAGRWLEDSSGFQIDLPASDRALRILHSTNLIEWSELFSAPANLFADPFIDVSATNGGMRFYRVEISP